MCLPSKKLYRGASCLFCLKKSFNVRTLSLVLLGGRYGGAGSPRGFWSERYS